MSPEKVRVGIIGAGLIAPMHAAGLALFLHRE
jgi:hypothetical protein